MIPVLDKLYLYFFSILTNADGLHPSALFGLPAELSEDARQTSGVGLSVNVSGTYEARISPDLRFRTSAGLNTRTFLNPSFQASYTVAWPGWCN